MSSSSEEAYPRRFRDITQVYRDTEECNLMFEEPSFYQEAASQRIWRKAMEEEIEAIVKNHTWILTPSTEDCKPIEVIRHKARQVAKGYVQKLDIDYEEVFALVARMETIRVIIALVAQNG
ncbi:unnamed protein product [Spirodela intermedia]|uniref:Reverse transcriptase Ty1/copia-type domain-containing protein n=1 Tax=Spirodela intermedia TaxID=51605 RepID=A0A7I8K981_SPIIN|nr:unnamed protein product [Spirodela intermedia]